MKTLALSCCLLAVVAVPAVAQTAPHRTTILFVGNSFVHGAFEPVLSYNQASVTDENAGLPEDNPRAERRQGKPSGPWGGIAAIFKTFTQEAGLDDDVHVELQSGMPLKFHYDNALPIVSRAGWDVVVLQDLSTGPILETKAAGPADFDKYTRLLEAAVHERNPKAAVWLYETFPRADLTHPAGTPFVGKPITAMGEALVRAYRTEAKTEGHIAGVLPVGEAWLRAIAQGVAYPNPYAPEANKLDLWNVDNYHPSIYGAYLNACVFFEALTGRDARTLGGGEKAAAALGVASATAVTLQRLAHETVAAGGA